VRDEVQKIALEAYRNTLRHARAALVKVELRYEMGWFILKLCDDGVGFEQTEHAVSRQDGHFGLTGMHERASAISARLAIHSAPGAGTEVELVVPASVAYPRYLP
jgi:signal transduction histidine kinase